MDSLQGYEFSISIGNEAEVVKVDIPIIGGGVIPLRIHLILGSQEVGCRTRQWGEHLLTSCGLDLALNVTSSEKPSLMAQFTVLSHHSGSPLPAVALSSEYSSLGCHSPTPDCKLPEVGTLSLLFFCGLLRLQMEPGLSFE